MKRAEVMRKIETRMAELKPVFEEYLQLERDLTAARNSFDIGEKVRVVETCNRGCCTERIYEGKIKSIQKNGMYEVVDRITLETIDSHVYSGDMQRI